MAAHWEHIAARMQVLGWDTARQTAFKAELARMEREQPRYKALTATQQQAMLQRAGQILNIPATAVNGLFADVYLYPQSLLYVWEDTDEPRTVLINVAEDYLLSPADTPYLEVLYRFQQGERTVD